MTMNQQTAQPLKVGSTVGTNQASSLVAIPTTESFTTFGGTSQLLGAAWTPSDINNSGFGIRLSVASSASGFSSNYLDATNFGFAVAASDTIVGIQFDVRWVASGNGTSSATVSVNYVRATITTTAAVYKSAVNLIDGPALGFSGFKSGSNL